MSLLEQLRGRQGDDRDPMRPISVRLDDEVTRRLDSLVDLLRSRNIRASRSEIIRDALDAYMTAFEAEFGRETG